jgi:hypothetical protein
MFIGSITYRMFTKIIIIISSFITIFSIPNSYYILHNTINKNYLIN